MILILQDDRIPEQSASSLSISIAGQVTDLRHLLLQKSLGRFFLVLWLNRYSYDYDHAEDLFPRSQEVKLSFQAANVVRVYRPLATAQPIAEHANIDQLTLWIPDHPLIIEIAV
jgi:hypothetical protein